MVVLPALLLMLPVLLTGCSKEGPAIKAWDALEAEFSVAMEDAERDAVREEALDALFTTYQRTEHLSKLAIYIIDHEGIIRDKNKRGEKMDEVVDRLLAEIKNGH